MRVDERQFCKRKGVTGGGEEKKNAGNVDMIKYMFDIKSRKEM